MTVESVGGFRSFDAFTGEAPTLAIEELCSRKLNAKRETVNLLIIIIIIFCILLM